MPQGKRSSLIIDLRLGECLAMSDGVTVELVHKSGQLARLRVTAPREVRIERLSEQQARTAVPSMAT